MPDKMTAPKLRQLKEKGQKIVAITAYDAPFAEIADESGADIILVGDSVGNTVLGYETTVPVTLDEMLHHARAVRRAVKRALLIVDLPFGTYQGSKQQAFDSAVALMKAGAEAVKLEGFVEAVPDLVAAGIPVMGHVGMTPQSVHQFGGFKIQGKGESAKRVQHMAKSIEEQGAFAIVLELIPALLSDEISRSLHIPTIGIGAGPACDGQVQVLHDVLGITSHDFRHAKRYMNTRDMALDALKSYAEEVRSGGFPSRENSV